MHYAKYFIRARLRAWGEAECYICLETTPMCNTEYFLIAHQHKRHFIWFTATCESSLQEAYYRHYGNQSTVQHFHLLWLHKINFLHSMDAACNFYYYVMLHVMIGSQWDTHIWVRLINNLVEKIQCFHDGHLAVGQLTPLLPLMK